MELRPLTVQNQGVFRSQLAFSPHELSLYSFENIFVWKSLFDIRWTLIDGALCVFFSDRTGMFLYFAPAGKILSLKVVRACFEILEKCNKNASVIRIENIEERERDFFEKNGFIVREKSFEYLCLREDLAFLKGDRYKSKRALCNHFIKHSVFEYLAFESSDEAACLQLYDEWMSERSSIEREDVYRWMMEDSKKSFQVALREHAKIGLIGRVVKIQGKVRACTFGYKLSEDIFCVLFEIADLSFKGIAQFIFREFSREAEKYRYINIMDDSGLENLRKVKSSYHPERLIPIYTVVKRGA